MPSMPSMPSSQEPRSCWGRGGGGRRQERVCHKGAAGAGKGWWETPNCAFQTAKQESPGTQFTHLSTSLITCLQVAPGCAPGMVYIKSRQAYGFRAGVLCHYDGLAGGEFRMGGTRWDAELWPCSRVPWA